MKQLHLGHYVPKLHDDYVKFAEWHQQRLAEATAASGGKVKPVTPALQSVENSILTVLSLCRIANCYTITPEAFPLVWNTDIIGLDFENARLPYSTIAIEYDFDYDVAFAGAKKPVAEPMDPAPRRIVFLTEAEGYDGFVMMSCYIPEWEDEEHQQRAFPVDWAFSPLGAFFPYKAFQDISQWLISDGANFRIRFGSADDPTCPTVIPALPMYKEVVDEMDEKTKMGLAKDFADEIKVMYGLFAILSCNNAPEVIVPAPAKLNKKRVKNGKLPIPTYRTLHVSDHRTGGSGGGGGGGPKRTHWRRGHIRNQKTAKGHVRKWIRPMIINADKGEARKPDTVIT